MTSPVASTPVASTEERLVDSAALRWAVYSLLIVAALAAMTARIMQVHSSSQKDPSPFLSANDRSRWCTIRALVDDGTYAIDDVIFKPDGSRDRRWHTIDLVKHFGSDGKLHYYSSKPTLLPTLLAGEYWLVKQWTGATLENKPFYVARLMLVLTNVLPMGLALWLLTRLVERLGTSDWGRLFAMTAACFATFVTTFSITLNNHSLAAVFVVFTLAAAWPIWERDCASWLRFALAGLFAAFTAANELPALSFFCLIAACLLWKSPLRTIAAFLPAAAVVAVAAFGTNYLAHGSLKTPYAHRHDGPVVANIPHGELPSGSGAVSPALLADLRAQGIELSDSSQLEARAPGERWELTDEPTQTQLAIVRPSFDERGETSAMGSNSTPAAPTLEVREWDNWYDYAGTYWTSENLHGVDRGEPSRGIYLFNVLIGHHGIFSLTPIWLFSALGVCFWLGSADRNRQVFAAAVILLTVVVLGFYVSRPLIDRNYGGVTSGLRWMFWFTPLWLLAMLPAVDWLAKSRWGQAVALALLAVSVFSAHYAAMNPWSQPWIFDYWEQLRWIAY
jgi:hypothetical protein